jgi:uncharacterized protein (TIGR02284 family)
MQQTTESDIKQLNSFLRGELSAIETYEQCISKITDGNTIAQLSALKESHRMRASLLADRVRSLGGDAADASGVWGSVAKLFEGTAKVFGQSAAISALEEGEDHGRHDYRKDIVNLSPAERSFIEQEILPEQLRTHDVLSRIESAT